MHSRINHKLRAVFLRRTTSQINIGNTISSLAMGRMVRTDYAGHPAKYA